MGDSYPDMLAWIDLETTGLDPATCHILEVGVLLTDSNLDEVDSRSWILHQSAGILGGMDEWCLRQHGKSGLLADSAVSNLDLEGVREVLLGYLLAKADGLSGKVPMAGASVHFDRGFLRRWMPQVEAWFYYGNLDVSSVEKLAKLWYPGLKPWEDRGLHRVDPDNEDAVAELRYYRENLFRELPAGMLV